MAGALAGGVDSHQVQAILDTTSLSARQKQRFLSRARANGEPLPEFWRRLRSDPALGDAAVDQLQLTLQLAAITLGHAPLIAGIKRTHKVEDARALAALDAADWQALVADIDAPDAFASGDSDPKARYAAAVEALVAKAFPTARLFHHWNRDPRLGSEAFRRFVANNPEFEFRDTPVRRFLADKPAALTGIADRERFVHDLEALHRVVSVIPDDDKFDSARALWQQGMRSAHAIVRTGHAAFTRRFSAALGKDLVDAIFARARKKTAASLATLVKFSSAFAGPAPTMFLNLAGAEPTDEIPDWRTLFGSVDFCDCRDCRSVLSPAAYFVDLLQFLQSADAGERNALAVLLDHRPDLAHIRLDCPNTNTPLPYIDLVNEVLENAVVHGAFSLAVTPALQTTAPGAELLANPEHIAPEAYDVLATATFPWSLPFNLWHEERRTYLGHLGLQPVELMDVFHRDGEPPEPIDRAAAALGLTRLQREIVTGAEGGHGLGTTQHIVALLRRTQTTFDELSELLTSQFVNPAGKEVTFEGDSCALEGARLNLTAAERDRLHRFRRFQQATDWSVFELDLAIEQIGAGRLDEAFVIEAAALHRIRARVGLPISELLAWWGGAISTRRHGEERSLYEALFLNLSVNNPLAPVETIFRLNAAGDELATIVDLFEADGELDREIGPLLISALRNSEADLRFLIGETLPSSELRLASLSHLFRVSSFSRALGLTAREYVALSRLTRDAGLTSFGAPAGALQPGSPEATRRWLDTYDALRTSGVRVDELNFLLAHDFVPTFPGQLAADRAALLIAELRTALARLRPFGTLEEDTAADPKLLGDVSAWLAQSLGSLVSDAVEGLRILVGESALSAEGQATLVQEQFAAFVDPVELLAQTPGRDCLLLVYERAAAFLARTAVIQYLATAFAFDAATAEQLLATFLRHPEREGASALDVFLDPAFARVDADPQDTSRFADAQAVLTHLAKLALVIDRLSLTPREVAFVFEHGPSLGWYDLRRLPLAASPAVDPRLDEWRRLTDAFSRRLRAAMHTGSPIDVLLTARHPETTRADLLAVTAAETGWELESLQFLTGGTGYAFRFPEDVADERWLLRLVDAIRLIRKAGVSASQAWSWNLAEATPALARAIKSAAKARHSNEQWLTIVRPLTDSLRARRRDALVDRLIARHDELADADALYERLLIDTQMQPCFLTSRIKQAISSVQLFVQRVLFGLEGDVRFESADRAQWEWRRNFRMREAALNVLLFPENFAEPELRDGKSPLFKELEEKLLEEEVTGDSVERAYLAYLRGLDEVARLEVVGQCEEAHAASTIWHIFGRTRGTPPSYYYRRWVDGAFFTPWEKVDINVEGQHVVPIVFNRRLWLLWPLFTQKHQEPADGDLREDDTQLARLYLGDRVVVERIPRRAMEQPANLAQHHLDAHRGQRSVPRRQPAAVLLLGAGRGRDAARLSVLSSRDSQ